MRKPHRWKEHSANSLTKCRVSSKGCSVVVAVEMSLVLKLLGMHAASDSRPQLFSSRFPSSSQKISGMFNGRRGTGLRSPLKLGLCVPRDLLANVTRWWALPARDNEDKSLSWDGDLSRLDIVWLVGGWMGGCLVQMGNKSDSHWPVVVVVNLISSNRLTVTDGCSAHLREFVY